MNSTHPEATDLPDTDLVDTVTGQPVGRRRLIAGAGAVAGATAMSSFLPAGAAEAALPAGASSFHILPKAVRLADTRERSSRYPFSTTLTANKHIRVKVGGENNVPATASAAVLTVTAVNFGAASHVTCWPTGEQLPLASNLNLAPGAVTANLVTVKLGSGGSVDVISHALGHLIVDVLGYYEPVTGPVTEGRYVTLNASRRVYDSRPAMPGNESYTVVDVTASVPPDASAVVLNLTAAGSTAGGHFTAMPINTPGPPTTSSLNVSGPGENRAAGVVVPVQTIGGKREIKVYAHRSAFIIVDVFGFYTGPTSGSSERGLFVPVTPVRLKDTRLPGEIGRMWPSWVVEVPIPRSIDGKAAAVAVNVTGVDSRAAGHLTVSPARRPIPNTSNVNWATAGAVVPNHVISQVTSTYGLQVYNAFGSHVLVDLAGYFLGIPQDPSLPPYQNPAPPPAPPTWIMRIPRLGLTTQVIAGAAGVVDVRDPISGFRNGYTWHWTGTGYMGQSAHVAVFGHRTSAGGPYRQIHTMVAGDRLTVTTGDGREFTYEMVRRDLTDSNNTNILNATRAHPGNTLSIVVCTLLNYLPTSTLYRLVVTCRLVSWREV
jgi:hypothetical protein